MRVAARPVQRDTVPGVQRAAGLRVILCARRPTLTAGGHWPPARLVRCAPALGSCLRRDGRRCGPLMSPAASPDGVTECCDQLNTYAQVRLVRYALRLWASPRPRHPEWPDLHAGRERGPWLRERSCRIEYVACTHAYALTGMVTRSGEGCPWPCEDSRPGALTVNQGLPSLAYSRPLQGSFLHGGAQEVGP